MTPRVLLFATAVSLSLVVLFTPGSAVPTAPYGTDTVIHLGLFALLASTGLYARFPLVPLAVALAVYAAGSEILQAVLPIDRSFEVLDIATDLAGLVVGAGLHAWLVSAAGRRRRARCLRETTPEQ